ncbi:DUF1254 domain-containing protein [Aureicoccus marinus]|uniref:DUF1254 domain-containing protein n=1 Tax=Aureicoccus marinus TaxID=754435 RepID=A0A2S7T639_9FLAO|nr:DUF1214 domain-containing protein [Aureicoccus marinus]PQJ15399.1 hypothetical protein BST99_06330 [Aureicoccus marinus]
MEQKRLTAIVILACLLGCKQTDPSGTKNDLALDAEQIKAIAKETYIALFPLVYNYGTMYNQVINKEAEEYIGGFGVYKHYGLSTPKNRDIPTPNNNTPYSWAWIDLRSEPWILTMPPSDGNRYYVSQWDDMWGYVIDAPGSILDGQNGGDYLLTTVGYEGQIPKGIKRAIYSESQFAGTLTRTEVNGLQDIPAMKAIQKGYELQPLSTYLGIQTKKKAEKINWIHYDKSELNNIQFFKYANFMLNFTVSNPADQKMLENAQKIGVEAGKKWQPEKMERYVVNAINLGIKEALQEIEQQVAMTSDGKKLYNTRKIIGEDYLNRTVGVVVGQFGNYPSQAMYPGFQKDSDGVLLDGSKKNYQITFPAGGLPKADYFWSFTMYDLPDRFLVENPINRYSIGSQTESLKKDKDGSLTIYFQTDSPGKDKEDNWLPTPNGPFYIVLRIYGPDKELLNSNNDLPKIIARPLK